MKSGKIEFLVALALAISALAAINACAIIDGGSGLSADELIDASNGIYVFNNGIPENPQVSRKIWSEESGTNFTMPDKLSGSKTNPQEARSSGQAKALSSWEPTVSPAASVAGNWSFRLKDSKNRFMALSLFQSESAVLGTGNMNDGGDTLKVLASGSISADKLHLDVISSGIVNLYRLSLNLSGNSASGEYKAFSNKGETWMGSAEGTLGAN